MRTSALSFCLLAATCGLFAQDSAPEFVQPDYEIPARATVEVRLSASGDVDFHYYPTRVRRPVDFVEIVRKTLSCDWADLRDESSAIRGTCRHLLGDGQSQQWLNLAPLVIALRGSGIDRIYLYFRTLRRDEIPVSIAGEWRLDGQWVEDSYSFRSDSFAALPPAIRIGPRVRPTLAAYTLPLLLLLLLPAAIALLLRTLNRGKTSRALIWLNWLQTACWLFWPTVLPPGRIIQLLEQSPIRNFYLQLTAGVGLYALPPLVATAFALLALRDRSITGAGTAWDFLRRHFLAEVALATAFGFPLIALANDLQNMTQVVCGILLGFVSGIFFFRLLTRRGDGPKLLEGGEFYDRVIALSKIAGLAVKQVSILWDRSDTEANAMVWRPGRHVFITDSLLRTLNKREVDAVISHEIGHLAGAPPWFFPPKFYASFFFVYTIGHVLLYTTPVSHEAYLPAIAFALLLIGAASFRRHEFRADLASARFTQDPRAMISGLGRAAGLRRSPLAWGRLEGIILSHPSFRDRAIALARASRMPENVALSLLENPDLLEGDNAGAPAYYNLVAESAAKTLVFSKTAKTSHLAKAAFTLPALLIFLVFTLGGIVSLLPYAGVTMDSTMLFLLGLPAVLWLALRLSNSYSRRFSKKVALAVARALPREADGEVLTLLPGDELRGVEGFLAWDFGKLACSGGAMRYSGERTSFSLPRAEITAIEMLGKRFGWSRGYGVLVRWPGGTFILRNAVSGNTRRLAGRLHRRLNTWWNSDTTPLAVSAFSLPEFPAMPTDPPPSPKGRQFLVVLFSLMILAGMGFTSSMNLNVPGVLLVLASPALLVMAYLPGLIQARRKRGTPPPPTVAEPPQMEEELLAKAQSSVK